MIPTNSVVNWTILGPGGAGGQSLGLSVYSPAPTYVVAGGGAAPVMLLPSGGGPVLLAYAPFNMANLDAKVPTFLSASAQSGLQWSPSATATMLGMAGYEASLAYARQRPQGRPVGPSGKDPAQAQVPIIEHADVKRMLLAQKSYCEGALALELYCARLVDEQHTGDDAASKEAALLLEVLTPIAKSWPSEWCLEANSLAIQVHGGYGYTRDFPVEQYWRDNRLNMIHEGTHGIQALDLLGRKVVMDGGAGLKLLAGRINDTVTLAGQHAATAEHANALAAALQKVGAATKAAWATGLPEEALANATPYLQAFGHLVLAWMWLDVALVLPGVKGGPDVADASHASAELSDEQHAFAQGKLAAMRYFFAYELPRIDAWLKVVAEREAVCRTMEDHWF